MGMIKNEEVTLVKVTLTTMSRNIAKQIKVIYSGEKYPPEGEILGFVREVFHKERLLTSSLDGMLLLKTKEGRFRWIPVLMSRPLLEQSVPNWIWPKKLVQIYLK